MVLVLTCEYPHSSLGSLTVVMKDGEGNLITAEQVRQHSTAQDCWLIINNTVWDMTAFAPQHPGGPGSRDASKVYNSIHAPDLVETELSNDAGKRIGALDTSTTNGTPPASDVLETPDGPAVPSKQVELPERRPLQSILSTHDFEEAASSHLSKKAWAFFSSAATDCVTHRANIDFFQRIWLRPRIMRDVRSIETGTRMLGREVSFPLFVSPTAMAKFAHPDGELVIAKAAARAGVAQIISTNASYPLADITAVAPGHPFFLQLYVNKNRSASEKLLAGAEAAGCKGVFVTVDQPTPGKREADERVKVDDAALLTPTPNGGATARNDARGSGIGRTMAGFIDAGLSWEDVAWLRRSTKMPVVLKGVQTAEDALLAVEHGVDGLLIGNHGGRSLDTATPAVMVLLELRRKCPEVFDRCEVFLDGGIRRGTDVFKALCLGAKAVGMGRHFMYAASYGEEGVEHLIELMREEFETTMRMMGCTDISQLHPGLLNLYDIDHWFKDGPKSVELRPKL